MRRKASPPAKGGHHLVMVTLTDEQYAAVEGWRAAKGIVSQPEALGELVRMGLLSEIAKIYRLVTESRVAAGIKTRGSAKPARRPSLIDQ